MKTGATNLGRERSIIDGIESALADVVAGRTVPHEAAMDQIDAVVARVRSERENHQPE